MYLTIAIEVALLCSSSRDRPLARSCYHNHPNIAELCHLLLTFDKAAVQAHYYLIQPIRAQDFKLIKG